MFIWYGLVRLVYLNYKNEYRHYVHKGTSKVQLCLQFLGPFNLENNFLWPSRIRLFLPFPPKFQRQGQQRVTKNWKKLRSKNWVRVLAQMYGIFFPYSYTFKAFVKLEKKIFFVTHYILDVATFFRHYLFWDAVKPKYNSDIQTPKLWS